MPLFGLTRSTRGCDVGVIPGMVKVPATCGVTRITIVVVASVAPRMISFRRDRSTTRNSNPGTTGQTDRFHAGAQGS